MLCRKVRLSIVLSYTYSREPFVIEINLFSGTIRKISKTSFHTDMAQYNRNPSHAENLPPVHGLGDELNLMTSKVIGEVTRPLRSCLFWVY